MPELLFETKVLQTMLRNFGNETRSSALLQSLVAHPRGIVLQGERNRASLTVESQGDRTENVTEEFRGRFRILEGTFSNTIISVMHKIVLKLMDFSNSVPEMIPGYFEIFRYPLGAHFLTTYSTSYT